MTCHPAENRENMIRATVCYLQAGDEELRQLAANCETYAAHGPKSLARKIYGGEAENWGRLIALMTPVEGRGKYTEVDELELLLKLCGMRGIAVETVTLSIPYSEYRNINGGV